MPYSTLMTTVMIMMTMVLAIILMLLLRTMMLMLLLMMMRGQYAAAAEAAGSPRLAAGFAQPGLSRLLLISRPASNEQESGVEVSPPPSANLPLLGQEVTEGGDGEGSRQEQQEQGSCRDF